MADTLKRAKAVRVSKKGVFTRKKNHLQQLLDGGAAVDRLKEAYEDLAEAFKVLENAHEEVLIALEEDQIEADPRSFCFSVTIFAELHGYHVKPYIFTIIKQCGLERTLRLRNMLITVLN